MEPMLPFWEQRPVQDGGLKRNWKGEGPVADLQEYPMAHGPVGWRQTSLRGIVGKLP
jgi:hypothetical protein